MPKDKACQEKLSNLREMMKSLLFLFVTTLIACATLIYQTMIGIIPTYMLLLLGAGLIALAMIAYFVYTIWYKSEEIVKELEDA